jgi:hypothetical protein
MPWYLLDALSVRVFTCVIGVTSRCVSLVLFPRLFRGACIGVVTSALSILSVSPVRYVIFEGSIALSPFRLCQQNNFKRLPGFHPVSGKMGFMVHEVTLRQFSSSTSITLDRLIHAVTVSAYKFRSPGFDSRRCQIFLEEGSVERGPLIVRIIEELLEWKNSCSGLEN